jgi:hypothetical protein
MGKNALISMAVFGVLLFVVFATREDQVRVGIRELKLVHLAKDEISQIEISGKKKANLKKEGDSWVVENPETPGKSYAVEQAAIDRALEAFEKLETGAFVSARVEKHADLEVNARAPRKTRWKSDSIENQR